MHTGLDEQGEMRRGTQAPIGHQHIPFLHARMDCLHPGQIVGEKGYNHQLQEYTGPQESGDGKESALDGGGFISLKPAGLPFNDMPHKWG